VTNEEAINILDDGKWWDYLAQDIPEDISKPFYAAVDFALAALREKAARDDPQPLTLEELRERVEKPIYIVRTGGWPVSEWRIIADIKSNKLSFSTWDYWRLDTYGTDWLAYGYPPKEVPHD
jgi:hypothetical protein